MDTREAIQNEFLKEYSDKEFSRITVKELCAMTPVTRTTFYSYYQNTAAGMKNSKMFTFFHPAAASDVAEAGYKASEKGKVLLYYGAPTKIMNIGSRLLPRSVTRKFAAAING